MGNKDENKNIDRNVNKILFIFLLIIVFMIVKSKIIDIRYKEQGIIDTGVVIDFGYGAKGKLYVKYEFTIYNGNRYTGLNHFYHGVNNNLKIGDSIWVKYLPTNPSINKLLVDKEHNFCKISQKDCLKDR